VEWTDRPVKTTSSSLEVEVEFEGAGDGLRIAMLAMALAPVGDSGDSEGVSLVGFSGMVPSRQPALTKSIFR
jgi:hypothetical protein